MLVLDTLDDVDAVDGEEVEFEVDDNDDEEEEDVLFDDGDDEVVDGSLNRPFRSSRFCFRFK